MRIVKTFHQFENLNHTINLILRAHMEKAMGSKEVEFIEELYEWHDKNEKLLLLKVKLEKILERIYFLKMLCLYLLG